MEVSINSILLKKQLKFSGERDSHTSARARAIVSASTTEEEPKWKYFKAQLLLARCFTLLLTFFSRSKDGKSSQTSKDGQPSFTIYCVALFGNFRASSRVLVSWIWIGEKRREVSSFSAIATSTLFPTRFRIKLKMS